MLWRNRIGVACDQHGTSISNSTVGPSWNYFKKYVYGFNYLYDPDLYPITLRIQDTSLTPFPVGYEEIHYDQDDSIGKFDIKMKLVSIPTEGNVIWDDNNDSAGKRPDSITVHIMDGTSDIDQMVVDDANDWAFVLNYPVPLNGAPLNYTIRVEDVDGYRATVDGTTITMTKVRTADIVISDVTLLSKDEYNAYKDNIPVNSNGSWWLRAPGLLTNYASVWRKDALAINFFETDDSNGYVRPLLVCEINETELQVGDKISLAGYTWTMISDSMILCDDFVGQTVFRANSNASDANVYAKSDVKVWLENWATQRGIMPEPEFEITEVTLLSKEEWSEYKTVFPKNNATCWWLRSLHSDSSQAYFIDNSGSLNNGIVSRSNNRGVRPVAYGDLSVIQYVAGDKVVISGLEWTVLNSNTVFCDEVIGETAFRADDTASDANVYDASDVKQWLADWVADHPFWTKTVTVPVIQ